MILVSWVLCKMSPTGSCWEPTWNSSNLFLRRYLQTMVVKALKRLYWAQGIDSRTLITLISKTGLSGLQCWFTLQVNTMRQYYLHNFICFILAQIKAATITQVSYYLTDKIGGTLYRGKSGLNCFLRRFNSSRHFLLTITDFLLKLTRCNPDRDRTRDRATYAIPEPNTISDSVLPRPGHAHY